MLGFQSLSHQEVLDLIIKNKSRLSNQNYLVGKHLRLHYWTETSEIKATKSLIISLLICPVLLMKMNLKMLFQMQEFSKVVEMFNTKQSLDLALKEILLITAGVLCVHWNPPASILQHQRNCHRFKNKKKLQDHLCQYKWHLTSPWNNQIKCFKIWWIQETIPLHKVWSKVSCKETGEEIWLL